MPAAPAPILVYDRIQANVRATRWLLLAFSIASFPVISAGAVFVVPFVMVFGGAIAFAEGRKGRGPPIAATQQRQPRKEGHVVRAVRERWRDVGRTQPSSAYAARPRRRARCGGRHCLERLRRTRGPCRLSMARGRGDAHRALNGTG